MFDKKVEIIGIGYIGLPLALLLAKNGISVVGVDIDNELVNSITQQTFKMGEEEIDNLLQDSEVLKNLKVTTEAEESDIFVIAVPTPVERRRKIADLSYIRNAITKIIPHLRKGNLVIIESTIPPLTCKEIATPMIELHTNLKINEDILLAHCPERILPGDIYNEIINNSRIIGGMNKEASRIAKEMYDVFVKGEIVVTDDVTAELSKLIENAYRDINIAFANEVAQVAEGLDINPNLLIKVANMHPRVDILQPGIGVGGHCIAVDPWFIKEIDDDNTGLIQKARRINDNRPVLMTQKIRKIISDERIFNPNILLLGASYKPNISDIRESPALKIFELMKEEGFKIDIKDPLCKEYKYENIFDEIADKNVIVVAVKHEKVLQDIVMIRNKKEDILIIELP